MNLQQAFDCEMNCEMNCETGCVSKHYVNIIPQDECSICLDEIESGKNKLVTECGHMFHTSCLLKNSAINGYGCPMCRTVLAEEPNDSIDEYEDDEEEDDELYSDHSLRGMRWMFQQARGEIVDDEDEEDDDDDDDESVYNNPSIDQVMEQLRQHNVTMLDVVKALVSGNYGGYDDIENEADAMYTLLDRIIINHEQLPLAGANANANANEPEVVEVTSTIAAVEVLPVLATVAVEKKYRDLQCIRPDRTLITKSEILSIKRNSSLNHSEAIDCWYL